MKVASGGVGCRITQGLLTEGFVFYSEERNCLRLLRRAEPAYWLEETLCCLLRIIRLEL